MKIQPTTHACDVCNKNFTVGYFKELSNDTGYFEDVPATAGIYYCNTCYKKHILEEATYYIEENWNNDSKIYTKLLSAIHAKNPNHSKEYDNISNFFTELVKDLSYEETSDTLHSAYAKGTSKLLK